MCKTGWWCSSCYYDRTQLFPSCRDKRKNQLSMSSWHTLKDEDGESCKRALKRILPRVLLVAFCSAAQRP